MTPELAANRSAQNSTKRNKFRHSHPRNTLVSLTVAMVALPASAASYPAVDNLTVDQLGAHGYSTTAGAYAVFIGTMPVGCNNGIVSFDYNTANGRTYYLTLLTAKVTGSKVYVDIYTDTAVPPNCYLSQARIK